MGRMNIPKCHVTPTADVSSPDISSITNCRSWLIVYMNFSKNSSIACNTANNKTLLCVLKKI